MNTLLETYKQQNNIDAALTKEQRLDYLNFKQWLRYKKLVLNNLTAQEVVDYLASYRGRRNLELTRVSANIEISERDLWLEFVKNNKLKSLSALIKEAVNAYIQNY